MVQIDRPVVLHQGVYKKISSVPEAIFMITGMTIGAGVLGLPYVVAQVGIKIGLVYIFVLGMVMLFLNLIVGDIAVRTGEQLQLPGFAGKYLGKWAKGLLSTTTVLSAYGVLLAYVVGEGITLSALFGGEPMYWSLGFWFIGSIFIWRGLQTVKVVEKFFSFLVMAIITVLSFYLLPKFQITNWAWMDYGKIFLPYGVILFALHATPAVVEAHALLPGSQKHYHWAVVIGTLLPMVLYMLFAAAVVGVSGLSTTEVATIGLGIKFGGWVSVAGNLFAALAMATGFMGMGMALKQTWMWDQKVRTSVANLFTISVPAILFVLGLTNFVAILDVVGGLFIGIEAVLMVLVCVKARRKCDIDGSRFGIKYFWPLAVPVLIVFSIASVVSVIKMFV